MNIFYILYYVDYACSLAVGKGSLWGDKWQAVMEEVYEDKTNEPVTILLTSAFLWPWADV